MLGFRLDGPTRESFAEVRTFDLVPNRKVHFHTLEIKGRKIPIPEGKREQNPLSKEFLVPWEKSE